VGRLTPDRIINLFVQLEPKPGLPEFVDRVSDPNSPDYQQWITAKQFRDRFGRDDAELAELRAFARRNGLKVTHETSNGLFQVWTGSVANIEKAFGVQMKVYQHPSEARTFYSVDREPLVVVNTPIRHINGFNDFGGRYHPGAHPGPLKVGGPGDGTGSGPSKSWLASDMRSAYNMGSNTGTGQVVGLAEFAGYAANDITKYFTNTGKTNNVPITNVVVDGGSATKWSNSNDEGEVCLDIQQVLGIATGLTKLMVYIGPESFGTGVDGYIFNRMASDNIAKQLSSSWWWDPDDPTTDDPAFQQMAAQGQSMFNISGDLGAYTSSDSSESYPAEDVNVTTVGGTSLTTTGAGGTWKSEVVWNNSGEGSGGGPANDGNTFPIPSWQKPVINSSNGGSTTVRNTPDVALQGDFNNYIVYDNGQTATNWGGTSFATPRWAAYLALVNQQRVANGKSAGLGFLNPTLYSIGQGTNYTEDFHDITSGNNRTNGQSKYYNAVIDYDLTTGWGSMNGLNLMSDLAAK
jgi:subtilase family serine protease